MEIYQRNKASDGSARLSSACLLRFPDNSVVDIFFSFHYTYLTASNKIGVLRARLSNEPLYRRKL